MTLILSSVLNVATPTLTPGLADSMEYPMLSAHRGGEDLYPENTLYAFKQIAERHPGVTLEFDLQELKDGTLVVIHDNTVDRVAANGATGKVSDMTLADWRKLRIKNPDGPPVPASTLDEVLDEFIGTDTILLPECKNAAMGDAFIQKLWPYRKDIIVQSNNATVADRLVRSGFHTLQVTSKPHDVPLVEGVYAVAYKHTVMTPELVDDRHTRGIPVWAWTVKDQTTVDRMLNMGVDGIVTSNPRLNLGVTE